MQRARPANDNWEFGFSTYKDASGELIPLEFFDNDSLPRDYLSDRTDWSELERIIFERARKIRAELDAPNAPPLS